MTTDHQTTAAPAEQASMTAEPAAGDVVLAVGDDDLTSALAYAVTEAGARSSGIHLVHVVRIPAVDGMSMAEVWLGAVNRGRGLLRTAASQARALGGPDLRVSLHLGERGTVAGTIVEQGEHAGVIVVQHRRLGRLRRVVTHSVTNAVAAHADAPVVAVPDGWSPGPENARCVMVGVQDLAEARTLISRAATEAARRSQALWIVHAGPRHGREAAGIATIADEVRATHPRVHVEVILEDASPSRLLVNPMTAADLIVLGRRHHTLLPGSHLGPVARAVLDDATCPVMLVKHAPQTPRP